MSMATYIGFHFAVKRNESDIEKEVEIDYVFSDDETRTIVKRKHFTTPYIYEVSEREHPIWEMNQYQKTHSPHNYEKSKKTFLYLCQLLKELLPKGDYCEIYISWIGCEDEECESKLNITLNNIQIDEIDIYEKCLIRIEN